MHASSCLSFEHGFLTKRRLHLNAVSKLIQLILLNTSRYWHRWELIGRHLDLGPVFHIPMPSTVRSFMYFVKSPDIQQCQCFTFSCVLNGRILFTKKNKKTMKSNQLQLYMDNLNYYLDQFLLWRKFSIYLCNRLKILTSTFTVYGLNADNFSPIFFRNCLVCNDNNKFQLPTWFSFPVSDKEGQFSDGWVSSFFRRKFDSFFFLLI